MLLEVPKLPPLLSNFGASTLAAFHHETVSPVTNYGFVTHRANKLAFFVWRIC